MKQKLLLGLLGAAVLSAGGPSTTLGAGAASVRHAILSVPDALQICVRARHRRGSFTLIVAAPRVLVRGYFVRVVGNGYPVLGESGVLYPHRVPTHGVMEQYPLRGGLNLSVPERSVPDGIVTGRWVSVHGVLRCYAPMGEVLLVSAWHPAHAAKMFGAGAIPRGYVTPAASP